jgi:hypothetical protein
MPPPPATQPRNNNNAMSATEQSHALLEEVNNREIAALREQVSTVRLYVPPRTEPLTNPPRA